MHSAFAKLNPRVRLCYFLPLLLLLAILRNPLFLITAFLFSVLLHVYYDKAQKLRKNMVFFLLLCLFFIICNPLFSHRGQTILFYLGGNPITLESFLYGLVSALSLLCVCSYGILYQVFFQSAGLFYCLGPYFPRTTVSLLLSLRFLPVLQRRFSEIRLLEQNRRLPEKSLLQKGGAFLLSLQILLSSSLEETICKAQSMRARGYGTDKKRSFYHDFSMHKQDWFCLFGILLGVFFLFYGFYCGWGNWQIYLNLQSFPHQAVDWLYYVLFCCYLLWPFVLEGWEEIKWLSCR